MDKVKQYWTVTDTHKPSIEWAVNDEHTDFIEMSGLYASYIVKYGMKDGTLYLDRHPVFPMLRTSPNNTHSSFQGDIEQSCVPVISADGRKIDEVPYKVILDGTVTVLSSCGALRFTRVLFPSSDRQAVCELITVHNDSSEDVEITISPIGTKRAVRENGCRAVNIIDMTCNADGRILKPGSYMEISIVYSGRTVNEPVMQLNVRDELEKRRKRVAELTEPLVLSSNDKNLDTLFAFSKIRAGESVFRTLRGDVHSPGGYSYYAAVWCNDQVEYSGPWFAYTGDALLTGAAYNAYSWYFPFMDDETYEKIPSSIIAEGLDKWDGAGDRGDAAMYLYGASRYMLTAGNPRDDGKLWRAVKWCAAYCEKNIDSDGVIESDSDELEGRLPSGNANLSTNMLAYGGFVYMSRIAEAMGEGAVAAHYGDLSEKLRENCDKYFAHTIHGFDTYRYYRGNKTLRSWICLPLCMDIFNHAEGTADAIMSPYLMSEAGQLSEEGTNVVWDRSTLYGLHGIFRAGLADKAYEYLEKYCFSRLLSDHVPYPIEAWPEGGKRHLSGESALFCQIITEGILGIDPIDFNSFALNPSVPQKAGWLKLDRIHAFGEVFSIHADTKEWEISTESGKRFHGICGRKTSVSFK